MMNEPTHTTSPQELIICKINSEEDSIILAFTYRSPNPTNENLEYFNIAMKCLGLSPTVLIQKCRFCNFQAVFGHFAQMSPNSRPHLTLLMMCQ